MTEQIKPFHYTAFPREEEQTSQSTIESVIRQRVWMERKYERLEMVLYILQHQFGLLPDELAMAIHMFTYDELHSLLSAALDADSLNEVIAASNRIMAGKKPKAKRK
ncbi:MAG: hypothetical protein DYG89_12930 [Caldilinea sp. CFX5]|nr:hypothetical protein [Caldilinea sp. CFX5]